MIEALFPYILPVHITTSLVLVVLVLRADHHGFKWIRGKEEILDATALSKLHSYVWLGLFVMIFTGVLLAYPYQEYLRSYWPFLAKMSFVLALLINGVVVGKLMKIATVKPFRELTNREKMPLFVSGAVSTLSWAGAILMATLLNL